MATDAPAAYLEAALRLIGKNALHARRVDWESIAQQARAESAHATDAAGTYSAIRSALRALGDGHSFLMTSTDVVAWRGEALEASSPSVRVEGRVARVFVDAFVSANKDACMRYAVQLQREIASVPQETIGWIVDLRANTGGNMGPMLCGLGPILGDGEHGSFLLADGSHLTWGYRAGRVYVGESELMSIDPVALPTSRRSIAILIGALTCSSGEAVAVAFRGLSDTRFFGAPTAGLSTCNDDFALSDGACLFLTTGVCVDRDGRPYPHGLTPDVHCDEGEAMALAQAWIESRTSSRAVGA